MLRSTRFTALVALVAFVTLMLAASVTVASAVGPSAPTTSVVALQQKLDEAGGSLHGYLKTVLKGSTVETMNVDVLAVTTGYGDGPVDMSSLILFKVTDPRIDEIGGIAAGMSGSPIYVDIDGTDTLVGALSYGDMFTLDGMGLATPIDAMVGIERSYASFIMPRKLSTPVVVDGSVKSEVLVVPASTTVKPDADTIVAKPMSSIYIGGLSPQSPVYKALQKRYTAGGARVVPLAGGLSSTESPYNEPFAEGSSVAALASRGDLWVGGIGTVTYTDGDKVLAFGHPAFWAGDSGLYLNNAWIDGVWPSTFEAYKLGRPAALRGTLTQDRLAGIMGVDGQLPAEASIFATATNTATGQVATSWVGVPESVINSSSDDYYGIPQIAAYIAGSRVFDVYSPKGSAVTTTTIRVSDGSQQWDIVRTSHFSDSYDIAYSVIQDVDSIVTELQYLNDNGIAHASILSVGIESVFSPERNEAEIVDVHVPGGIRHGLNTAKVSLLQYGQAATRTVDVTFTVPANVPVAGDLTVEAVNDSGDYYEYASDLLEELGMWSDYESYVDRRTVAEAVADINDYVDNTVIELTFKPTTISSSGDDEDDDFALYIPTEPPSYKPIAVQKTTPWVVSGDAEKVAPYFSISGVSKAFPYGSQRLVRASLVGPDGKATIKITGIGAPVSLKTIYGTAYWITPQVYRTGVATFSFAGNDEALPVTTSRTIAVAARTTLSASTTFPRHGHAITLTGRIYPLKVGGSAVLQVWSGYYWRTISTRAVPANGVLTWSYTPKKAGSKVKLRARFLGSASNAASKSNTVTLYVR